MSLKIQGISILVKLHRGRSLNVRPKVDRIIELSSRRSRSSAVQESCQPWVTHTAISLYSINILNYYGGYFLNIYIRTFEVLLLALSAHAARQIFDRIQNNNDILI